MLNNSFSPNPSLNNVGVGQNVIGTHHSLDPGQEILGALHQLKINSKNRNEQTRLFFPNVQTGPEPEFHKNLKFCRQGRVKAAPPPQG